MKRTKRKPRFRATSSFKQSAQVLRAKPGTRAESGSYHIELRPRTEFRIFRTHDVGKPGGIERVAGKRHSGSWGTQKWLISKRLAHVEKSRLVPDNDDVREILDDLGSVPVRIRGDRFRATPRGHGPETPAEKSKAASRRHLIEAEAIALHRI